MACSVKGLLGTGASKGVLGTGSTTRSGSGSGSLNCGTIGETFDALELDEPNGDGIGGVVINTGDSGNSDDTDDWAGGSSG